VLKLSNLSESMHKKTDSIFQNLGFSDDTIKKIKKSVKKSRAPFNRRMIASLRKWGVPDSALKQIKFLEEVTAEPPGQVDEDEQNKTLITQLIKKVKRTFNAFSNKNVKATIVIANGDWTLYATDYTREIQHLHEICKPYFDEWSLKGIEVKFTFSGNGKWKIITPKKADLPDNLN